MCVCVCVSSQFNVSLSSNNTMLEAVLRVEFSNVTLENPDQTKGNVIFLLMHICTLNEGWNCV